MICKKERQRCWRTRLPSDRRRLEKDRLKYAHTYTFEKMPPGLRGSTPARKAPSIVARKRQFVEQF